MSSYELTKIAYPSASATEVSGIDASGAVTGLYIPAGQQTVVSFIWSPTSGYKILDQLEMQLDREAILGRTLPTFVRCCLDEFRCSEGNLTFCRV